MERSVLKFISDNSDKETAELLEEDIDKIRSRMSEKSDEERFKEQAAIHTNPRLQLLLRVRDAESSPSYENSREVIRCAVNQHDFVTALHWHKKLPKNPSTRLTDKFERYYYALMAELQKKHQPDAEPCTSVEQMCSKSSDTSRALRDPDYLERSINYRTQLAKAYQEKFDSMEKSFFLPAKKKDDKSSTAAALIAIAFIIAGIVTVWKTYGTVATAIKNFFGHGILSLISWIIPIIYAVLVLVLFFVLAYLITKGIGNGNKKKVKQKIWLAKKEIEKAVQSSEDYLALQEMNKGIDTDYQNYDSRLVLAALSAMSGEQDVEKLCKMIYNSSTWLSEYKPFKKYASDHYKTIDELFKDGASDTDLFLGYTLTRKLWAKHGLTWFQSIAGLASERKTLTPQDFKNSDNISRNFIAKFIEVPFGGDNRRSNTLKLFYLVERFMLDEALLAEKESDYEAMGYAYFILYRLCVYGKNDRLIGKANEKIYTYGMAGIDHCDEFKYYVMHNKACYYEDHEYYDPYEALGYTRTDAIAYANRLSACGDSRGRKLHERFEEVDRRAAEREAEARAAEARAYWEERSRIMREAEEAREKARAELNAKMDSIERDANLWFNGQYATMEERITQSNSSDTDKTMARINYEALREAAIRKKLDDM